MAYKQLTNSSFLPVWKPTKIGDMIEGYYIGKEEGKGIDKKSTQFILATIDGDVVIWGTALLNDRFSHIKPGTKVKIIYLGKAISKTGRSFNKYEFYYDDEDILEGYDLPNEVKDIPEEPFEEALFEDEVPPDIK